MINKQDERGSAQHLSKDEAISVSIKYLTVNLDIHMT